MAHTRSRFKLNAYDAIRNPDSMPVIVKRGIANMMIDFDRNTKKASGGPKLPGVGSLVEEFVYAFNTITNGLTDSGHLKRRTLELTSSGMRAEATLHRRDEQKRRDMASKTAAMKGRARVDAIRKNAKIVKPRRKLAILDRKLAKLKADLEAGKIRERL